MRALIANSRGPESLAKIAAELGPHIIPATVDRALDADIIFFAVGFLHFKEVAAKRPDWTGKIVIDVTNAFMLPPRYKRANSMAACLRRSMLSACPGRSLLIQARAALVFQNLIKYPM
jgi:predicted dinucleotide-binding enzyme